MLGPGLVLGRNDFRDLPVGTVFTSLRRTLVCRGHDPEPAGPDLPIRLTLGEISWYSRFPDALPGGHTGTLRVSGDGWAELERELRDAPEGVVVSLVATFQESIG